ncbi:MAG: hypothetical protein ACLFWM_03385 [Actinomycetota bacterium]
MKWAGLMGRPSLIWEAVLTAWAFRVRRGLLPARHLLRWRIATAYGRSDAEVAPQDLVRFLEWRKRLRAARRSR